MCCREEWDSRERARVKAETMALLMKHVKRSSRVKGLEQKKEQEKVQEEQEQRLATIRREERVIAEAKARERRVEEEAMAKELAEVRELELAEQSRNRLRDRSRHAVNYDEDAAVFGETPQQSNAKASNPSPRPLPPSFAVLAPACPSCSARANHGVSCLVRVNGTRCAF